MYLACRRLLLVVTMLPSHLHTPTYKPHSKHLRYATKSQESRSNRKKNFAYEAALPHTKTSLWCFPQPQPQSQTINDHTTSTRQSFRLPAHQLLPLPTHKHD
jgi:hypothetical protein